MWKKKKKDNLVWLWVKLGACTGLVLYLRTQTDLRLGMCQGCLDLSSISCTGLGPGRNCGLLFWQAAATAFPTSGLADDDDTGKAEGQFD